jgi:hypothetical protein
MGAIAIAEHGYPARIILGHYFPGTTITALTTTTPKATPLAAPNRALTASVGMGVHAAQ